MKIDLLVNDTNIIKKLICNEICKLKSSVEVCKEANYLELVERHEIKIKKLDELLCKLKEANPHAKD